MNLLRDIPNPFVYTTKVVQVLVQQPWEAGGAE